MGHFPSRPGISNVLKPTRGFQKGHPCPFSLDLDWLEATAGPWNEFTPRNTAPGAVFCVSLRKLPHSSAPFSRGPFQMLNICLVLPRINIPMFHLFVIMEHPCSRCWAIPGNVIPVGNLENPQGKQKDSLGLDLGALFQPQGFLGVAAILKLLQCRNQVQREQTASSKAQKPGNPIQDPEDSPCSKEHNRTPKAATFSSRIFGFFSPHPTDLRFPFSSHSSSQAGALIPKSQHIPGSCQRLRGEH